MPDYLSDRQVVQAVANVPPPFREALILADARGFSYQEIADMTGAPIGTVMSRLSRGRGLLREGVVLVNSDVTDTLRVAILTSIPVLARMFGALRDSPGVIQEPCGASA